MSATCNSCGAAIRWATFQDTGKSAPFDAVPAPLGNVAIFSGPSGDIALVMAASERARLTESGGALYLSHFASCPNASQHRRQA